MWGALLFSIYRNMLSRSGPRGEMGDGLVRLTTIFLKWGKSEPRRFYRHGPYRKKKGVWKGGMKGEGGMRIQVRIERSLELKNVITDKKDVITSLHFLFF